MLDGRRLPFSIEVVGFSEEEGVRFGVPFIGSRALAGTCDADAPGALTPPAHVSATRSATTDSIPTRIGEARGGRIADRLSRIPHRAGTGARNARSLPLGIVEHRRSDARRGDVHGRLRPRGHDADDGAPRRAGRGRGVDAAVEREALRHTAGLVATVGRIEASARRDQRHCRPRVARASTSATRTMAFARAARDRLAWRGARNRVAARARRRLGAAARSAGGRDGRAARRRPDARRRAQLAPRRSPLSSGAGHDAMILAGRMPAAMLIHPQSRRHQPSSRRVRRGRRCGRGARRRARVPRRDGEERA